MTTYLLAGGGTAGHVNPLLAIADRLRARDATAEVLVLGTAEGIEARLVPERGYELITIPRLPFPRRPSRAAIRFPKAFGETVTRIRGIMRERGVDVVVGVGGYAAAPAYVAANRESLPLAIHEANARPGIANRLGARYTSHVGVAFEGTPLPHATVVGMPLRVEIEVLDRFAARQEAIGFFGLVAQRPTLLVTGGSSGALRINETISESIAAILGVGWQVIHITGEFRDTVDRRGLPGYHVLKYCDRMELALAVADLAVTRAGTSTVAELAAVGVPAVFVPYAVGNGEQKLNARQAVLAGGAIIVSDAAFTPQWVSTGLISLLRDRARIAEMAARIATTGIRDATDRMIAVIDSAASAAASRRH
ncbi:MAG: UDP-N-acetylglucosamine--N-acetylmuramyl-(pentapeptide) pyrophosphoryl-undecaprenol N-acetylglucosamine transferase [Salinibacterium sp.]|nr:UDP-N-acetylglucosamine--N-acetylmuramyl-(pentapeptide) pyrophosphoryl-undecaprenol N-acetylglucosamine transferase [Salinibacterium sp.]